MAYDVIVCGQLCADLLPDATRLPLSALSSPGKLFEVGALTVATGGAVANTGLAFHRLGVNVGLMSSIGDDLLGQMITSRLNEYGGQLGDLLQVRRGNFSSYSVIISPENTDRIILHCPGINEQFDVSDVNFAIIDGAKFFHLGYPTLLPRLTANGGEALAHDLSKVSAAMGVITSLDLTHPDPNSPNGKLDWGQILANVLPYVDIFLPSIEEIIFMLRRADYDRWQGRAFPNVTQAYLSDLGDELLSMGVKIAGFKLGEYGFYLKTAPQVETFAQFERRLGLDPLVWAGLELYQPAFDVTVVGATGAGDCAYAGFLTSLLHQASPQAAIRFACAVGACNVESPDATSGVRSLAGTWADGAGVGASQRAVVA
ncbi:MAG: carbohydrate kinase family protein [Chloroflexi bacterium]|uniref:carbohydrate kinase family protein n=1 Tax=Candidatus Flexifilum breve TaxID=3140694 RepID=UPI003136732E|nr:carbohydrate kinase family protein [Chloroflexota bacterium]